MLSCFWQLGHALFRCGSIWPCFILNALRSILVPCFHYQFLLLWSINHWSHIKFVNYRWFSANTLNVDVFIAHMALNEREYRTWDYFFVHFGAGRCALLYTSVWMVKLSADILQSISAIHRRRKVLSVWNEMMASKWWKSLYY